MESIADNPDGSAVRDQFTGKDQILAGISGMFLLQDLIFGNSLFHEILFHGRAFRTGLVAALPAGDDDDGAGMLQDIFICLVKPQCKRPAGAGGTHMGAQDDDIVLRLCGHGKSAFQNHCLHTQEKEKTDRKKQDHAHTDGNRKVLKKADPEQPSKQQKSRRHQEPYKVEQRSKTAVDQQQYEINEAEKTGNITDNRHKNSFPWETRMDCFYNSLLQTG